MAPILRTLCLAILLVFGGAQGAAAQTAEAVVAESARAMGIEGLNSIKLWGSGASFTVGQNNNANGPWPRTNLNDFTRWIDFTQPAPPRSSRSPASPAGRNRSSG